MLTFAYLSAVTLAGFYMPQDSQPKPPVPAPELKPPPGREVTSKDSLSKPMTVSDVVKSLGLDEAKVTYIEEAPGKLRVLAWSKVKLPGTEIEVDIEIQIGNPLACKRKGKVYHEITISPSQNTKRDTRWDIKELRDVAVLKVTISPPRKVD